MLSLRKNICLLLKTEYHTRIRIPLRSGLREFLLNSETRYLIVEEFRRGKSHEMLPWWRNFSRTNFFYWRNFWMKKILPAHGTWSRMRCDINFETRNLVDILWNAYMIHDIRNFSEDLPCVSHLVSYAELITPENSMVFTYFPTLDANNGRTRENHNWNQTGRKSRIV